MANAFKGQVSVEHEGKRYALTLDFNALADFEGQTGKDPLEILEGFEKTKAMSINDMRAFFWAALIQEHPEVTMRDAGRILSSNPKALAAALSAVQPDADAGEGKPAPGKGKARKKARAKS